MDTFEQFVRDFLAGKVEEYVKSEPIPESNDEPVKVTIALSDDFFFMLNFEITFHPQFL